MNKFIKLTLTTKDIIFINVADIACFFESSSASTSEKGISISRATEIKVSYKHTFYVKESVDEVAKKIEDIQMGIDCMGE